MSKRNRLKMGDLCRLLVYVLGNRPDEFGLVPDHSGFVTYKELLWALHEEPGWAYVRQGHINEVLVGRDGSLFQSEGDQIRTLDRRWHLDLESPCNALPKILFVAVRRKAHAHVMEKGLSAGDRKYVMLSDNSQLAYRIAKRRDQKPVMLEVTAAAAEKEGISFYPFGQLFLAHHIPVSFISGPPVSPETSLTGPASKRQREVPAREGWKGADPGAGTFVLDLNRDPDPYRRDKAKKKRGWKEEARKMRRRDSR